MLYTSDHGEMLGEHGLWQKFVFYEPSVGVPLIVRVPGLTAADARSKTPVSLVQVMPTLLELCHIGVPAGSGWRELRAGPGGARAHTRHYGYSEYNLGNDRAKYMIRRGDFKYNFYKSDTPELYDLRKDPSEMHNLASLPEYRGKVDEMKAGSSRGIGRHSK